MKKINFFITADTFPSISVTGKSCALMCKHCRGKLLSSLIPALTCEELEKKALSLHKQGAKGLLLTGGCDSHGKVPIGSFIPAIRKIKEKTDLILIVHTGFITGGEAAGLRESGIDGIGFDVLGDMTTAREIYGLEVSEYDYIESLRAIGNSGIMIFPHVCVGLHFGKIKGEVSALTLIQNIKPATIIITGLMSVAGTPMEHVKPDPSDFGKVIKKAKEMFPATPIVLGCAHSSGKDREEIERIALDNGINGIAAPAIATIGRANRTGYEIYYYGACCGLMPDEKMRLSSITE
ncbi:MAG TPA: hypothetical protein VIO11_03560 [Candidatus Methanoperedens sp.]